MKTNVSQTSIDNHSQNQHAGIYSTQERLVLKVIKCHSHGITRREIDAIIQIGVNAVSGRCNSLLGSGKIKTNGKRRCSITGRMVWVLVA